MGSRSTPAKRPPRISPRRSRRHRTLVEHPQHPTRDEQAAPSLTRPILIPTPHLPSLARGGSGEGTGEVRRLRRLRTIRRSDRMLGRTPMRRVHCLRALIRRVERAVEAGAMIPTPPRVVIPAGMTRALGRIAVGTIRGRILGRARIAVGMIRGWRVARRIVKALLGIPLRRIRRARIRLRRTRRERIRQQTVKRGRTRLRTARLAPTPRREATRTPVPAVSRGRSPRQVQRRTRRATISVSRPTLHPLANRGTSTSSLASPVHLPIATVSQLLPKERTIVPLRGALRSIRPHLLSHPFRRRSNRCPVYRRNRSRIT